MNGTHACTAGPPARGALDRALMESVGAGEPANLYFWSLRGSRDDAAHGAAVGVERRESSNRSGTWRKP